MKKHILLLGLILLLVTALFVGCDKGNTPTDTTVDPDTTVADATETPTETPSEEETTEAPTEEITEEPTAPVEPDDVIELVKPDTSKVIDMAVTDKGYDIYRLPEDQDWGYRYGVTYLYDENGEIGRASCRERVCLSV